MRELIREPEAVFWVFVFPIVLAAILGLAFRSRPPDALPVGDRCGTARGGSTGRALRRAGVFGRSFFPKPKRSAGARAGQVVLLVSAGDPPSYAYDPTQPESRDRAAGRRCRAAARGGTGRRLRGGTREVTEPGARYVDFLVPGLLGMNLMGTGMWGIGFSLVVARNGNLLKRLVAAPARRSHMLGAQLTRA